MFARPRRFTVFLLSGLLGFAALATYAQEDPDDPTTTAERDAKEVLGDRAQPPDLARDAPPEGVQQGDNAGSANITVQSQGTSHTESSSSSSSSSSWTEEPARNDGDEDRTPVAGEIANNPPPPPGWPGHDRANPPRTVAQGPISNVDAGPIWNNDDAQGKCPDVCGRDGRTWTGDWRTVGFNKSVCACAGDRDVAQATAGQGTSCAAPANHQCGGCSVQCPPGKEAHCEQGDRGIFTGDNDGLCSKAAVCECR